MWVITEDDKTLWEDGQVNESNTECMRMWIHSK
jgi:hypothetical protein